MHESSKIVVVPGYSRLLEISKKSEKKSRIRTFFIRPYSRIGLVLRAGHAQPMIILSM